MSFVITQSTSISKAQTQGTSDQSGAGNRETGKIQPKNLLCNLYGLFFSFLRDNFNLTEEC